MPLTEFVEFPESRREVGRKPLALRWMLSVLLGAALAFNACARPVAPAEPRETAPADLAGVVNGLPKSVNFGLWGLAFFKGQLMAASNVGLLQFEGERLAAFYRWYEDLNVVSGPWLDAQGAVWAFRDDDARWVRMDTQGVWQRFDLPPSPVGGYSRGDMLEGFTLVTSGGETYMRGGGAVWRLLKSGAWQLLPMPPSIEKGSSVIGFARDRGQEVWLVKRGTICGVLSCEFRVHRMADGQWSTSARLPLAAVAQTLAIGSELYVRGTKGELLRIASAANELLQTPGPCEALAVSSAGRLLASFRDLGVFEFDGTTWTRKLEAPYPRFEGEHWVFLAEDRGRIALATTAMSAFKPAGRNQTGTTGLWLAQHDRFVPAPLPWR